MRHGHDGDFGICLVHRHGQLHDGHAIVHSCPAEGVDRCQMQPIAGSLLYPYAFLLDEDENGGHLFILFEYSSIPHAEPDSEFVTELMRLLETHGLRANFGLCHAPPSEPLRTEYVDPDSESTFATQSKDDNAPFSQNGVITQWGFLWEGAKVRVNLFLNALDLGGRSQARIIFRCKCLKQQLFTHLAFMGIYFFLTRRTMNQSGL